MDEKQVGSEREEKKGRNDGEGKGQKRTKMK